MEQLEFFNEVKRRVIIAILADDDLGERLVLKGGNLLQFAYELSFRASKDVDISVDGDFADVAALEHKVFACLSDSFSEKDLVVIDFKFRKKPAKISEDLEGFWGGYLCEFKLIENEKYNSHSAEPEKLRKMASPVNDTGSPTFSIDFSRYEFCEDKEEFEIDGYTINGYSPRMFVAEKIRALCQQMPEYHEIVHRNREAGSRARDFVDVHVIASHYGVDFDAPGFHEVMRKTFDQKRVPLNLIGKIKEYRAVHEPDFDSVRPTVSTGYDLQDFGFYFDWLCMKCDTLKPLWRV